MENRYEPNNVRIPAFFKISKIALDFLEKEYGYARQEGINDYNTENLIPVSLELLNDSAYYFSEVCYAKNNIKISVTYGEREHVISVLVGYGNDKFALWEIIGILHPEDLTPMGSAWVVNTSFLQTVIDNIAAIIRNYIIDIENPKQDTLHAIQEHRKANYIAEMDKERHRALDRAWSEASDAFSKKDHAKVIKALSPYQDILSPAQAMKLQLAKKYSGTN
jgi:hypothetical protein